MCEGHTNTKKKIGKTTRSLLEEFFHKNRKPKGKEIQYIIDLTGMKKRNIQVWFSNRRQRDKISIIFTSVSTKQQQQQSPIDYSMNNEKEQHYNNNNNNMSMRKVTTTTTIQQ